MQSIHPDTYAQERAAARFRVGMARAASDARLHRTPHCPLGGKRVELNGELYIVEQQEDAGFDTMSNKGKYRLIITRVSTGRSTEFSGIWDTTRVLKSGTVKRTVTGPAGKFGSWEGMLAAHLDRAADRLADRKVAA